MHEVIKIDREMMTSYIIGQMYDWKDYSSCSLNGKILRLRFRNDGKKYEVTIGEVEVYNGDDIQAAIDAYEESQLRFR